jgi:hypothetical protein
VDVFHRHVQLHRDKGAHPRRVQNPGHADYPLPRKPAQTVDGLAHRVERIRHRDDDRVRRVLDDLLGDRLHDLEIDVEQIIAAHPGLARDTGRDHDHIGASGLFPALLRGADAHDARVGGFDRTRLEHVERHPLRFGLGDVDNHDVRQLPVGNRPRNRRADSARATDDGDFSVHDDLSLISARITRSRMTCFG